ncbi:MAG: hypothetical protein J6B01_04445 [Ruminococcus sp.]|nr:hypothetical protein [Ruminococcus sp.]
MSKVEKWKDICLKAENVASEVLDCPEAKDELSVKEIRDILRWAGDDEFVTVTNDKRIVVRKGK